MRRPLLAALVCAAATAHATPAATAHAAARGASELDTVAERSNFERTGRYDEVLRLCDAFPKAYPGRVRCEKFGVTPEGRPMVALVAGKRGPTLLFQGGIHAGEIDGKDAGFQILRQLLDGKLLEPRLAAVKIVFVPVFNVDGHERFGQSHRPNQIGPVESGWRTTAQNLNLNRDYMKAQAPEMRAMLHLLDEHDPIVYVDLHVTDGAQFQHDVAVLVDPSNPARGFSPGLTAAGAGLRDRVLERLKKLGHLPLGEFYPQFMKEDDPASGFPGYAPEPRFSDAYWALRNRIGILVETHSWKDYATRVRATRDVLAILVEEVAQHGSEWQKLARAADGESIAGTRQVLELDQDRDKPKLIDFLGYAYERVRSAVSGKMRIIYDPKRPEVWHVPFYDVLVPTVTATAPQAGYFVPAAWVDIVKPLLDAHGIRHRDVPAATLAVQAFRAATVKLREGTFEGREMATVKGAWTAESRAFSGGLFVPLAQPRARVAVALLEPEGPDSLTAWGFFDGVFERKEYMEDYVLEAEAAKMLADPALKRAFDDRVAHDEAFATNPRARLDFFYRRHPAWDEQYGLIPVFRLDRAP